MEFIVIMLISLIGLMIVYVQYLELRQKHFVKTVKRGDPCLFYLNGKVREGIVLMYVKENIYSHVQDNYGNIHRVFTEDITPPKLWKCEKKKSGGKGFSQN